MSTGTIELGYIYTLGPRFIPHLIKDFTEIDKNKDIKIFIWAGHYKGPY